MRSDGVFPHVNGMLTLLDCGRLEERRKVKSAAYYARKKAARRNLAEAQKKAN
jgi:hypothetical protein